MFSSHENVLQDEILKNFPEFRNSKFCFNHKGWTSVIVDIDNKYICKFPRDFNKLSFLLKENKLISLLEKNISHLIFPKRTFINTDLPFFIHKKIKGDFFTCEKYYGSSLKEQSNFINSMANFFYCIHNLKVEDFEDILPKKLEHLDNIENILYILENDFSKQDFLYGQKILENFQALDALTPKIVVGYYDMHPHNCLVDSNKNLISVFDFDEMAIGTVKFDLRELLLNYDKTIGNEIIQRYNLKTNNSITQNEINTALVAWSFYEYRNMKIKLTNELKEVENVDLNIFKQEVSQMIKEYAKEYL